MFQMNEGLDAVLIAPSPRQLADTLGRAAKAANLRCRSALVKVGAAEAAELGRAMAADAEGCRQWLPDASGGREDNRSVVAAAWWTDRVGRRHVRVKGARWSFQYGSKDVANTLCPYEQPRPPLWMVYPDSTWIANAGGGERVLVACPCGEAGTPERVGWMGGCCAACHDRREEGQEVPGPVRLTPTRSFSSLADPVSFSPDGRLLARVTYGGAVLVLDLETGEEPSRQLDHSEWHVGMDTGDVAFLPDGRTLAMTGRNAVLLLDVQTGERREGPPPDQYLKRLAVSPDGSLIAVAGGADRFAVWRMRNGARLFRISVDDCGPIVTCAAFTQDGTHLAVGCGDGTARLWDVETGREAACWGGEAESARGIQELAVSPDGRLLATLHAAMADNLFLRDMRTGEVRATWTLDRRGYHPRSWLRLIAFSPDGRTLAASERDGVVRFFDVAGGPAVGLALSPKPEIRGLAFQPGGRWLAAAGEGGSVSLWPWAELLAAMK
jgi:hypothetical protein